MAALKAWSCCTDCGHQGALEYRRIAGESYDDAEALGVMMQVHCPVCDARDNTLVSVEFYSEMVADPSNAEK